MSTCNAALFGQIGAGMTTSSERIELIASDGARISAYHTKPQGPVHGALVVVQEIFGVNEHIRGVCDGFARDGYETIAPAFFDRVEPDFEVGYDEASVQRGRALMTKLDLDEALLDVAAAIAHLTAGGPTRKVGIVGYCWGGTVAFLSAARLTGLHVAVGYYGGGIAKHLEERPHVPTVLHFGEQDKGIPLSDVALIRSELPELAVYTYPAGHGFNCEMRGSYHAPSAELARGRTLDAFKQHLG
jgi:carboxymethylenebutenolidase